MTGITVSVRSPTKEGRLYPRYDDHAGILAVESEVERPWPFGVDVDGELVFDLDNQRVLANFDLHLPKARWPRDLRKELPAIAPPGDLVFTPEAIAQKSFHLPLRVSADRDLRLLLLELASIEPDLVVALSDACVALVAKDELVGFVIRMFSERR